VSDQEIITLTIDGQQVQAPKGTSILEAAKTVGISIPYYCYHPGLKAVGSCRMCLVEIEKMPKLQPSCTTPIGEGMVVRTKTPAALRNRQAVLEFLLLNHPLDCPVCDQSGECELQNYYMQHGLYDPRFNEDKRKLKKATPIGPHVMLDQERCILCTRCVRFTRDVSKTGELSVFQRGHKSVIDIFPGMQLNNPYSGNVVDICPVGALTDRDFRFQCRVWFLGRTPSICPGCSRGCNIEIHFNERFNPSYHEKRVQRLKPRYNKEVNGYWICDEGRYAYPAIDAENRLRSPRIRTGAGFQDISWEEAIDKVAADLKATLDKYGPQGVGLLASPQMTNEELFFLSRISRDQLKISNIEFRVPPTKSGYSDDFLITADKNPNTRGADLLGFAGQGINQLMNACAAGDIHFLYICHQNLSLGLDDNQIGAALGKVGAIVYQGSWEQSTAALASLQLPAAVYAEKTGTFTNVHGRVQIINAAVPPLGKSLPDLDIFSQLAVKLDLSVGATSPSDIFREIGQQVQAFAGMTYQTIGGTGQLIR
jgi:NADH-quinone oxidoreductase subunit G